MDAPTFEKPLPEFSAETKPFWDALKDHRLVVQRCTNCGTLRHYPRPMCDQCFSFDHEWIEASGKGTVHSWTVAHHPFHMGFKQDLPYVVLTVDLEEGVRMVAPLDGSKEDDLKIGLPVRVFFEQASDDVTLPRFKIDG